MLKFDVNEADCLGQYTRLSLPLFNNAVDSVVHLRSPKYQFKLLSRWAFHSSNIIMGLVMKSRQKKFEPNHNCAPIKLAELQSLLCLNVDNKAKSPCIRSKALSNSTEDDGSSDEMFLYPFL